MRTLRVLTAGAVAVTALVAGRAWAQSGSASVDPALQAAVTSFGKAFDAADPKAFAAHFASDGTVINPMGAVAHGPADIEKEFARDGAPVFKGSHSTLTITGSRQLGPDYMWLDVDHQAQNAHMPDGSKRTLKPHMVILAHKQGAEWKWAEVRAWLPRPREVIHGPRPK